MLWEMERGRNPGILHADVDAFFASVAQRDDPNLRGRPVIVGDEIVMAASYEARAFGVRSGIGGRTARRLCPDAAVVQPDDDAYARASAELFEVLERTAPLVEPLSMEEAFLDVRALDEPGPKVAERLRREVRDRVGLPVTVGVARTTVLAKMASRAAKPDGLLVVPPGSESEFLHPVPVERLWSVGPASARKLRLAGIATVGDVAALPESALVAILGRAAGRDLHAVAHHRETRPVWPNRPRRSFGSQRVLGRGTRSPAALDAELVTVVERVTARMRSAGRAGRTVVLRLRFDDLSVATRSRTLPEATAAPAAVLAAARALLDGALPSIHRRELTLVGVSVENLDAEGARGQLALPLG